MLEFYFDCSSPWTYLAFHTIPPIAAEFGAPIVWKPILVGGVFNKVNPSVYVCARNTCAGQGRLCAEGPRRLGAVGRSRDPDAAERVSGQQREGDARLHPSGARRQAGRFRAGDLRGLLGPRRGHFEG